MATVFAAGAMAATVTIGVTNDSFGASNASVTISAGDTVTWQWHAGYHTVTSGTVGSPDGKFDGAMDSYDATFTLSPGTAGYPFNQAGTYPYYCQFHGACCNMHSSIVVRSGAATPYRTLGGASQNSVATARSGAKTLLAAASGTKLYLMNALDSLLGDAANWAGGKDLGGTVSGRPSFGSVGGALALAVGTNSGRALVFDVASGGILTDSTMAGASIPTAPAFVHHTGGDDVYWGIQTATGPALVRSRAGAFSAPLTLGVSTVTIRSSPAIFDGTLVVGTSADVRTFRVDPSSGALTPQSIPASGDALNTSPVVSRSGEALVGGSSGKVYKINLATGATDGAAVSLPAAASPLSEPFYTAATDTAAFGGKNGSVYYISAHGIGTPASLASTVSFGSGALVSPLLLGANTFAADAVGDFGMAGGSFALQMGSAAGGAVAATGTTSGVDRVIANTVDGKLFGLPVP
jgi:plastocyanin